MEEEAAGRRAWSEEARANRKRAADLRSTELWRNEQDRIDKLNPTIPADKKEMEEIERKRKQREKKCKQRSGETLNPSQTTVDGVDFVLNVPAPITIGGVLYEYRLMPMEAATPSSSTPTLRPDLLDSDGSSSSSSSSSS